ncbi:hypothetical protein DSUL_80069 [Desulfovibrionales bacterium]
MQRRQVLNQRPLRMTPDNKSGKIFQEHDQSERLLGYEGTFHIN